MNETQDIKEILRGHNSADTAYVVDDYPYGFTLRCKIRYWLEAKAGKGFRLCSQTTNVKAGNGWTNKPKCSTYSMSPALAIMYRDGIGHVQWTSITAHSWPEHFDSFRASVGALLNDEEKAQVDKVEALSRKWSPKSWGEWDAKSPVEQKVEGAI
jgi:hypothetical protein